MLTRTRITSMLLTLLFVASLIFAVSSLVTEPDKAGYSAVTVGVFGGLLLLHLRKWRWTPEALVACMTLLVVANSDVNFMRSNVSLTVLLPAVLAAVLLSPRWTIGVFIATMLGLALFMAVAIGEGTTIAFGPNFSVINLLTLTIITAGIATSSAVARAGQRAAEEQAHQAQTTARRADETLALLDTVVQSAPIGFAFFDTALRYQLITPRFAAVNRLPTEEHLGHTAHEVSPEFATTVEPFLRRVLDTGAPILDVEMSSTTSENADRRRHWLCSYYPVRTRAGEVLGVGAVIFDITDRKDAEAALLDERARLAQRVAERTADLSAANAELARAARLKDEFLASMSHELRTPLNTVLGVAEALREQVYGPLTGDQDFALQRVDEAGRHLLELINDILDLAKIGAGKFDLAIEPTLVQPICQASLLMVRQAAHQKRITIEQMVDPAARRVLADARRLRQILINLLSNAVKFTPNGGTIGLEVSADAAQHAIHFTVWDTGIGIAADQMERLFQPFVQLDGRLSRQYAGTGLGLALVARMTELHGGSVTLTSTVGAGSRFTVALPWSDEAGIDQPVDASAATPGSTPEGHRRALAMADTAPSAEAPGHLQTILLAEDNEANISTIADYLTAAGYRVIVARNGGEAIMRAHEVRPALILMDIQMPELDGLEATRCIRANQQLSGVPIIALTALAMPGDRERCFAAGANDYLSKPVGLKVLAATIARNLSRKSC